MRFTAFTNVAFYVLQLGAVVRFSGAFSGDVRTWVYIGVALLALVVISFATWYQEMLMGKPIKEGAG